MDKEINMLKELCDLFGPSGCEDNVISFIKNKLTDVSDELIDVKDGSLIAIYHGNDTDDKRMMLTAHADESGFMVKYIDDDGYIKFEPTYTTGVDTRVLPSRKMIIGNDKKTLEGIVGSKPIHLKTKEDRKKVPETDELYVDIGTKNKKETEEYIYEGDYITFANDFIEFGNNFIRSKALDDRVGCFTIINLLKRLKKENIRLPFDLYCAFTVKSEIRTISSKILSYIINPYASIIIDAVPANDLPGIDKNEICCSLNNGVVVPILNHRTIYSPAFIEEINRISDNKVNIQFSAKAFGENDAKIIQLSGEGVKTAELGFPVRNIHTASNIISKNDLNCIGELLYSVVSNIDLDNI